MRRGITLVELLVVIGILAVLFGIGYTILSPVRREAKVLACLRNLKQVGIAIRLYREDWGGRPPPEGMPLSYWKDPRSWYKLGLPPGEYVHCALLSELGYTSEEAFRCPAYHPKISRQPDVEHWKEDPCDYSYIPGGAALGVPPHYRFWVKEIAKKGNSAIIMECWNHNSSRVCDNKLASDGGPIDALILVLRLDGSAGRVWADTCSIVHATKIIEKRR